MYYAIAPDGTAVYSFKRVAHATDKATELNGFLGTDATDTESGLTNVPTSLLIKLHNIIRPEKPVAKFENRAAAERRLRGVLEVLSVPGTPIAAPSAEESPDMPAKKKPKVKAKKTTTGISTISDAVVARVIKLRGGGKGWPEILVTLGEAESFIKRVRPLMKKVDRSSVAKLGPGSPNYGKKKAKK